MKPNFFCAAFALILLSLGTSVAAQAAKLYVSNNGVNSATCGTKDNPCRSINQAITNANAGDKIIIGPGKYGDLNGNGIFEAGTGEEIPPAGCACLIEINKLLTLESTDGAEATVLNAGGASATLVRIAVSGVVFGGKKKGFTLTKSGSGGLVTLSNVNGIRVIGNIVSDINFSAFAINGNNHVISNNSASGSKLSNGFYINGNGNLITGNLALNNLEPYSPGFAVSGNGNTVTKNIARNNKSDGFFCLRKRQREYF